MLVDESRNQLIVTKASAAHDYSRIVSGFQFLGYFVARICISHGPLWLKIKPRTLLIKDKKKDIVHVYCTENQYNQRNLWRNIVLVLHCL